MKLSDFYKKNEMISLIFTEMASKMANRSSHFLPWFWSFTSVFLVVRDWVNLIFFWFLLYIYLKYMNLDGNQL